MNALAVILFASAIYFAISALALRDVDAVSLLTIEIEKDADGWHTFVIDIGDDAVLYVSDSFKDISDAVRASQTWIEVNG